MKSLDVIKILNNYSIVFLVMIYSVSLGQSKDLDGFLGMKWGTSKKYVKQEMSKREGVILTTDNEDSFIYHYGVFANNAINFWRFNFYKNKLASVNIYFDYEKGEADQGATKSIIGDALIQQLKDKYGEPSKYEVDYDPNVKWKDNRDVEWSFKTGSVRYHFLKGLINTFIVVHAIVGIDYLNYELNDKYEREHKILLEKEAMKKRTKAMEEL